MTNAKLFILQNLFLDKINGECSNESSLKSCLYDEDILGIKCNIHSIMSNADDQDCKNCKKHLIFIHGTYACSTMYTR